ncbi:outer membrane protein [Bradyrhizobium paxllaeri]|uniref:outer membrane protein n=1 Tax=Bradyrhizobium paxllaeri TaxID=190148 RepID=UPI000810A3C6|nr:outer membrane beta-barrel protein [Bradyrhizobium paxllaeri]
MKKMMLGPLALAVLGTNSALAADLGRTYTKSSPPVYLPAEPVYSWTGFYVGGHLGGAFSGGSIFDKSRFAGGLQVGGDYQLAPNWIVGVEGQYSWLSGGAQAARFSTVNLRQDRNALGSITGRIGYVSGPTLLYVKGGWAYQDTTYGVARPNSFTLDNKNGGYTIGTGFEYLFASNWSSKIEYQYYNFGSTRFVAVSPAGLVTAGSFDNNVHSVKVGLNYRFK